MRNKKVLVLLLAFTLTAVFYASAIDWGLSFSSGRFLEASLSYAMSLLIASLPFFGLHSVLKQIKHVPPLQWFGVVVLIALPLVLFPFYRAYEPSNGWDYLLVPLWQLAFVGFLKAIVIALTDGERNKSEGAS